MMVGVASGTYSSIFIASPVLTEWKEREPAYRSPPRADQGGDGLRARPSRRTTWSRSIDEVERHVPAAAAGDGSPPQPGEPHGAPAPTEAPVAVADPPVERAAPASSRPPRRPATAVAGRPEAERRADAQSRGSRKKQSRRKRKRRREAREAS